MSSFPFFSNRRTGIKTRRIVGEGLTLSSPKQIAEKEENLVSFLLNLVAVMHKCRLVLKVFFFYSFILKATAHNPFTKKRQK